MPKFKLRHVIICEDVRREISGKDILLGVFDDVIVVQTMPANIDRLFFRIAIDCDPTYNGIYSFALINPKKDQMIQGGGHAASPPDGGSNRIFGFATRNFPAQVEGKYEIAFDLGDKPKPIWDFTIRSAKTTDEVERLARAAS